MKKKGKRVLFGLLAILILITIAFGSMSCMAARPDNLGVKEGKLALCPSSPNCVSSQSTDKEHSIDPLKYQGESHKAMKKLEQVVSVMPGSEIIENQENYLYAEFTSFLFRFVDDVEFYLDDNKKIIHVRSASRSGQSDFGVNRGRIEAIRKEFAKASD